MPTQNVVKNKRHVAHLEQVRRQTEAIKIGSIVIIVLILAILAYGLFIDPMVKAARPVANVNGETVSVARFQAQAKIQRLDLLNSYQQYLQYAQMFGITDIANDQNFGPAIRQIEQQLAPDVSGKAALDAVVDDLLIRQEAKRRNITVSAEEVEQELQASTGYFPKGTPTATKTLPPVIAPTLNATQLSLVTITPTGDPATATATSEPVTATNTSGPVTATNTVDPAVSPTITLTPTVTVTSTATITATVTATTAPTETAAATGTPEPTSTPITEAGYKELLKKQVDELSKNAKLSEDDLRRYYENNVYRRKVQAAVLGEVKPEQEQVWARHILVATEEEAKKVIDRLNKGEDFGNLAKELSTDTGSGAKGGDLGWFGTGAMVAEFQTAAFALKVGEISQPVKSQFGYHIIQALGHENRQLDADGYQRYKDQSFADFLKKLRETSKIEEFDLWKQVIPNEPALPDSVQQQLQQIP